MRLLTFVVLLCPAAALAGNAYAPWTCGKTLYCTQGIAQGDHVGSNYYALDFGMAQGEPVLAARAGTVSAVKTDGVGGCCSSSCNWRMNYVTLNHGDGTSGLYYHLDTGSSSSLWVGQWVARGTQIGRAGFTGFSCGNNAAYIGDGSWADASASHLHFLFRNSAGASVPISFDDIGSPVIWGQYTSGNCGTPASQCGGLTYTGECAGETVRWCEGGQVKSKDCTSLGQVCGYQDDAVGFNCVADPCQGLGYAGECSGETVRWCENGQVNATDCTSLGMVCRYKDDAVGHDCVAPSDPCGGLTAAGTCEASVLRWCEASTPRSYDCARSGMGCGWQSDAIGNNCIAAPPADPCEALGYAGRCDGSTLEWCEGGQVTSYNCAWAGMGCGWESSSVGYNCRSGALSSPGEVPSAKEPPPPPKANSAADEEAAPALGAASGCTAAPGLSLALLAVALPALSRRRSRR